MNSALEVVAFDEAYIRSLTIQQLHDYIRYAVSLLEDTRRPVKSALVLVALNRAKNDMAAELRRRLEGYKNA